MSNYKAAFEAASLDLSTIMSALGFTSYPGIDPMLRAITDLILVKAEAKALREEVAALRARVVVVHEPVTMDGKTTIREYVANAAPADLPMDAWTQGYEECKRRIHAMFEQPCNKRLNGKAVSERLLRRAIAFKSSDPDARAAQEELSTLLGEGKEVDDA